jgi:hypothetical protein
MTYWCIIRSLCFFFCLKDGTDLSPPVVSDANEDLQLSRDERNFLGVKECVTTVLQFPEQYYQLYDSNNRDSLVSAHHDNAVFSVMWTCPLNEEFHYIFLVSSYLRIS